jgi:hypothetical protein
MEPASYVRIKQINIDNKGDAYMFRSVSTGIVFLLVFSIIMQGCATIMHGSNQDLPIKTMPPDVIARIDTQSCVTPCTLRVSRLAEKIHFTIEGDTEMTYPLFKSFNTFEVYFGNIIFLIPGVFIGAAIDHQTGAKYTIKPVNIVLPDVNQYKSDRK